MGGVDAGLGGRICAWLCGASVVPTLLEHLGMGGPASSSQGGADSVEIESGGKRVLSDALRAKVTVHIERRSRVVVLCFGFGRGQGTGRASSRCSSGDEAIIRTAPEPVTANYPTVPHSLVRRRSPRLLRSCSHLPSAPRRPSFLVHSRREGNDGSQRLCQDPSRPSRGILNTRLRAPIAPSSDDSLFCLTPMTQFSCLRAVSLPRRQGTTHPSCCPSYCLLDIGVPHLLSILLLAGHWSACPVISCISS
jgi:hypothetical protein